MLVLGGCIHNEGYLKGAAGQPPSNTPRTKQNHLEIYRNLEGAIDTSPVLNFLILLKGYKNVAAMVNCLDYARWGKHFWSTKSR